MALQRFVETYSAAAKYCEHINSTPELRERYKEAILRSNIPSVQKLTEKMAAENGEVDLYRFPVSRFDHLNQNKRKYPRKLWERVIRDQTSEWKGRCGLMDHPPEDSDGEAKNAAILWLDMDIDDANKLVWAIGTFVGQFGALAKDIVSKGGRIGFSSSGFGELKGDRETVDPETYVLERCADIVLNPSQDVFGDQSDALNVEYSRQEPKGGKREPEEVTRPQHESVRIKENRMDQNEGTTLTEGTVASAPLGKQGEKKFRRDISKYLEDAGKMESPQARLAELTDILSLFEDGAAPDLRAQIEGQLLIEKASLEQQAAEAQKVQETFGIQDNEQLKIGVALLAEEVNVAAAEAKDWEAISLAMRESNNKLREALTQVQAEVTKRPDAKAFEEAKTRIAFLEAQRRRQLFAYNEETKVLEEQLADAKGKVAEASQKTEEASKAVSRKSQEMKALEERLHVAEKVAADRKALVESIGKEKAGYNGIMTEAKDTIDRLSSQTTRLQANLKAMEAARDQAIAEFEQFKEDLERSNTPRMEPRFAERSRGYLNFDENGGAAVENYWADLISKYGESISAYERQIRTCKTYREAYSQFLKILPDIDVDARAVARSRMPDSIAIPRAERLEQLEEAGMAYGNDKGVIDRNSSWAQ